MPEIPAAASQEGRDDNALNPHTLHVHELEWAIRELAFENYDLRTRLNRAEEALHMVHGSRGWRLLDGLRRLVNRGRR